MGLVEEGVLPHGIRLPAAIIATEGVSIHIRSVLRDAPNDGATGTPTVCLQEPRFLKQPDGGQGVGGENA